MGALAACGTAVSTSSFKGEEHAVAQAISNLQADATSGEQKKICANDLAKPLVAQLNRLGGSCEAAIKSQLTEVDSLTVEVQSVKIASATATAAVKSIYAGKSHPSTVTLAKEGGKWRVSGLQ